MNSTIYVLEHNGTHYTFCIAYEMGGDENGNAMIRKYDIDLMAMADANVSELEEFRDIESAYAQLHLLMGESDTEPVLQCMAEAGF